MKKHIFLTSILLLVVSATLMATNRNKAVQTKIKSGEYIARVPLTQRAISRLPIPASFENYAFLQAIGNETSVVIGSFTEGEEIITWIYDKNTDGTVDQITEYYVESGKFKYDPHPAKTYSSEKFKQLKTDIINGSQNGITPNIEGATALKSLISKRSDKIEVKKSKQGYYISVPDVDELTTTRVSFMYSDNGANGVDLIFNVDYHNVRETHVSPVIKSSVYCKGSFDTLVKEQTRDLLDHTAENYPYIQ